MAVIGSDAGIETDFVVGIDCFEAPPAAVAGDALPGGFDSWTGAAGADLQDRIVAVAGSNNDSAVAVAPVVPSDDNCLVEIDYNYIGLDSHSSVDTAAEGWLHQDVPTNCRPAEEEGVVATAG